MHGKSGRCDIDYSKCSIESSIVMSGGGTGPCPSSHAYVGDITALCAVHATPYLLVASGSTVRVLHMYNGADISSCIAVPDAIRVQGLRVCPFAVPGADRVVLAHGDRLASLLSLDTQSGCMSLIVTLPRLRHWILAASLWAASPATLHIVLGLANNSLTCFTCSPERDWRPDLAWQVDGQERSLLYSMAIHLDWDREGFGGASDGTRPAPNQVSSCCARRFVSGPGRTTARGVGCTQEAWGRDVQPPLMRLPGHAPTLPPRVWRTQPMDHPPCTPPEHQGPSPRLGGGRHDLPGRGGLGGAPGVEPCRAHPPAAEGSRRLHTPRLLGALRRPAGLRLRRPYPAHLGRVGLGAGPVRRLRGRGAPPGTLRPRRTAVGRLLRPRGPRAGQRGRGLHGAVVEPGGRGVPGDHTGEEGGGGWCGWDCTAIRTGSCTPTQHRRECGWATASARGALGIADAPVSRVLGCLGRRVGPFAPGFNPAAALVCFTISSTECQVRRGTHFPLPNPILQGHTGRGIWQCAAACEGKVLITGGADGAVHSWLLSDWVHGPRSASWKARHADGPPRQETEVCRLPDPGTSDPGSAWAAPADATPTGPGVADSRGEYVRCLAPAGGGALVVATNRGRVWALLDAAGPVSEWRQLWASPRVSPPIHLQAACSGGLLALTELSGRVVVLRRDGACLRADSGPAQACVLADWAPGPDDAPALGAFWGPALDAGRRCLFTTDAGGVTVAWAIPVLAATPPPACLARLASPFRQRVTALGSATAQRGAVGSLLTVVAGDKDGAGVAWEVPLGEDRPCEPAPLAARRHLHAGGPMRIARVLPGGRVLTAGNDGCAREWAMGEGGLHVLRRGAGVMEGAGPVVGWAW